MHKVSRTGRASVRRTFGVSFPHRMWLKQFLGWDWNKDRLECTQAQCCSSGCKACRSTARVRWENSSQSGSLCLRPFFPHIDFQPRAQIKRLFEESELVSGDREAIRKFSDKYIVPEKLVAEHVEHLIQIKMRKEKKKEETETEQVERLNRTMTLTGLDCTTPISCRPWEWTSYPCTFPITRSPSKGRKLQGSQWSKRTFTAKKAFF